VDVERIRNHSKAPLWMGDPDIVELAGSLRCEVVDLRA
jgi:hypothetical protein